MLIEFLVSEKMIFIIVARAESIAYSRRGEFAELGFFVEYKNGIVSRIGAGLN